MLKRELPVFGKYLRWGESFVGDRGLGNLFGLFE
jgi:hypothetical protein